MRIRERRIYEENYTLHISAGSMLPVPAGRRLELPRGVPRKKHRTRNKPLGNPRGFRLSSVEAPLQHYLH